jgi:hypothetical protein
VVHIVKMIAGYLGVVLPFRMESRGSQSIIYKEGSRYAPTCSLRLISPPLFLHHKPSGWWAFGRLPVFLAWVRAWGMRHVADLSTKFPLFLQSNERELWTGVTALNINVAYLCASQVNYLFLVRAHRPHGELENVGN